MIQLTAGDGHRLDAYRADATSPASGGVVVLQEAFGVNAHIRSVCDDYAQRGYTAVAPALYDRQRRNAAFGYDQAGLDQARALRRGLDYATVLLDTAAAVVNLRPLPRVGVVGYCVGGSGAWLAACHLPIDGAACYYPSDIGKQLDEQPRCPVVMHFAERDHFIPMSIVEQFRARHPDVPAFIYPADHGFNCSDRSTGYAPESARQALKRTLAVLRGQPIAV
jgi:carboxymethylenebutenolidase